MTATSKSVAETCRSGLMQTCRQHGAQTVASEIGRQHRVGSDEVLDLRLEGMVRAQAPMHEDHGRTLVPANRACESDVLPMGDPPRSATSTPVRLVIARPATSGQATPTAVGIQTRAATPTVTSVTEDETAIQESVGNARAAVERVLRSAALPQIEALLLDTVALATPTGGEQLEQSTAARWLRQRATGRIRIVDFQRHRHQTLIVASTSGWNVIAPLTTGTLEFTLRRYDASGAQDPDNGDWRIDVIEAE